MIAFAAIDFNMNINKKNLIAGGLILCSLCVIATSVYAYLVDSDENSAEVTVGECEITVIEDFPPPDGPFEPGDVITKKPWVKNVGTVPCYVRIRADVSDGQIEPYLDIDFNSTEWSAKEEDGYYYYLGADGTGVLEPEEETEALFTTVTISETIPDDCMKNFDIYVYAEAVQTYGFTNKRDAWLRYTPQSP